MKYMIILSGLLFLFITDGVCKNNNVFLTQTYASWFDSKYINVFTGILFSGNELFKKYIIAGPALQWNDRAIFKLEEKYAQTNRILDAVVYTGVGNLDE